MKHSKLIGLIISAIPTFLFSQDLMVLKNSDEIKAKVVELTDLTIKYKKWENVNGPTYNISRSEVLFIRYENGTKEVISTIPKPSEPDVVAKPSQQENMKLFSTAPTSRKKRMVRLSWNIASAEFYDSKLKSFGFGGLGYSGGLDLGLRLYEKNDLELGFLITPLNIGIHTGASNYDFANEMAVLMNNSTNSSDWYVRSYPTDGVNANVSGAIGVYALKNTPLAAIKTSIQVGTMGINGTSLNATVSSYSPYNDILKFHQFTSINTRAFINPSISFLIGKQNAKVRWSINMDYKSMWYTAITDGSLWGTIYGTYVNETVDPIYDIMRTGIFNFGIGISGF